MGVITYRFNFQDINYEILYRLNSIQKKDSLKERHYYLKFHVNSKRRPLPKNFQDFCL